MKTRILMVVLLVLAISACTSATPTSAPAPTATRVPPTATLMPTVTPIPPSPTPRPAPTTEELLKMIAEIPLDAYPFLKNKEFMTWLQHGDPTPTPMPPLPAGPINIKWTASNGTPYEFVYYPPKQAPALMLFVYFPIIHGLERDTDWALWLQYLGKSTTSFLPYRVPGQAAPLPQSPNDRTAMLGLKKYPGCSTRCKMDEMQANEDKWQKDISGFNLGEWLQDLLPGTDRATPMTMIGKSYGGYAAMYACATTPKCSNFVANSPYILSQSSQKADQVGQQLQKKGVHGTVYTYDKDPYIQPFMKVSGYFWTTYTISGQNHGLDFPIMSKNPDFKTNVLNCGKVDIGKLQAELNQKKAELEKKRKDLGEAQQKLDKLARLLQDKRMQDLARAGGQFLPLTELDVEILRVATRDALILALSGAGASAAHESQEEGWRMIREKHGDNAVKEFQNAFAKVLNREADKIVALHAQVRELEAKVQELERQIEYDNAYCSAKK